MRQLKHKSKYNNIKTTINGIRFDSKAEGEYYLRLLTRYQPNEIKLQPKLYFTDAKILYKPDFLIIEDGRQVYIDVKGVETAVFKIKMRLFKCYSNAMLRIVKKKGKNFVITNEVIGTL
jgi:predicted nuclease of restriction endonuclease-like RecB superfamily